MKSIGVYSMLLVIVAGLLIVGTVVGQLSSVLSISNIGNISYNRARAYICGNYNSTYYYAKNNATGNYELISSSASQTISFALSKLTSGRTWQENVTLEGNFLIDTTITLSQGYVLLDCRQATLTSTASIIFDVHSAKVTFLGGYWIGASSGVSLTAIRFYGAGVTNCLVDGIDAKNFDGGSTDPGVIYCAGGTSYLIIQNCVIHDCPIINFGIDLQGSGYHKVINCTVYNCRSGIFVSNGCVSCEILNSEFYGNGNPDVYLDGGSSVGNNLVHDNKFHKGSTGSGGAVNIKSQNNKIYNNQFYNFPTNAAVPFSIYSQYSNAHADNNEIYNNTFTDCYYTFWIGGNPTSQQPEVGNKIYNNTFTRCTYAILLNFQSSTAISDTWIYYNTFISCTAFLAVQGSTNVSNTVVAYNDFSQSPVSDKSFETSYTNTMVYGNINLADYNVPSPLPIPPP